MYTVYAYMYVYIYIYGFGVVTGLLKIDVFEGVAQGH